MIVFDVIKGIALSPIILVSFISVTAYEAVFLSEEEKKRRQDYNTKVILHLKYGADDPDEELI